MKQLIRDYLTFNKRERNGLFVLILILLILILYLNTSHFFLEPEHVDFSKFEKELAQFDAQFQLETDSLNREYKAHLQSINKHSNGINNKGSKPEYFNFNPNKLSSPEWKKLGFSDKQIKVIRNYETKGGSFIIKEDLKKMYCISPEQYSIIEPYIQLPIEKKSTRNYETIVNKNKKELIDLNSSDSLQLSSLSGIGPFYAKAIIKYRNSLGGFTCKEQLMEIWKFDSVKFNGIKEKIIVDKSKIRKLNINTFNANELKHPYLSWNITRSILNYRSKHGKYNSLDEIKKIDILDENTFNKIAPYIIVE